MTSLDEPKRLRITDAARDNLKESLVIHAVEKFADVHPPNETVRIGAQKFLSAFNGGDEPLIFPARPGIENKHFVINGYEIIVKQPMHHTITDRSDGDDALFVITNSKDTVGAMTVNAVSKFTMKVTEVPLKIVLKSVQFLGGAFAFAESEPALPDIS